jgi:hypothetical protein
MKIFNLDMVYTNQFFGEHFIERYFNVGYYFVCTYMVFPIGFCYLLQYVLTQWLCMYYYEVWALVVFVDG